MKKLLTLLICALPLMVVSCYTTHKYINSQINTNGKIAIIIADTKYADVNKLYADSFTSGIAEKSKLTVITQSQIKSILGTYPERIQGPYKAIGMDEPKVDYSRLDSNALAAIAQKLKVQYIYAFWFPTAITADHGGAVVNNYWYIAELIEYPSKNVMAQGQVKMMYVSQGVVLGSAPKSVEEMCKYYSENIIKEMIENTNIGK